MLWQRLRTWGQNIFSSASTATKRATAAVVSVAMIVAVALVALPAQAASNKVADPTTFEQWREGVGDPTDPRSTGRVWTDKSVSTTEETLTTYTGEKVTVTPKDDSFLVGLSALSSAQKLIGVANNTKPLDIVLVLDTSGSMAYNMDGERYTYEAVYSDDLNTGNTYYIPNGDGYRSVTWSRNERSWGYTSNRRWVSVTPKTGANDTNSAHTQFYDRQNIPEQDTRLYALKQAVNGFIDQTNTANSTVSDPNKKNRIGLVTYATNAEQKSGLTSELNALKTTVNGLQATGSTHADLGLQYANTLLTGEARADASKIVIFFTDGEPGGNSTTSPFSTVAPAAVQASLGIKNAGAMVYSVGIFEGADASANVSSVTVNTQSGALRSNAFMQAVSSNYPQATNWYYSSFGPRAANSNYYLAASDADALNAVFEQIWGEVASNPTSPITSETTGGTTDEQKGAVTFVDQLGDYMHVSSMNSVVFAGTKFEFDKDAANAVVKNGNVTTYTFYGDVAGNEVYKAAKLQDLKITVTSYDNAKGDTVQVEVPADLLPLRLYTTKIDKDGNITSDIARTHPIRLFYDVALKDGVEDKVAKPDEEMRQYIEKHTDDDGNVFFLTNDYDTSAEQKAVNGTTTATFKPATTNDFYYFTENTPLYNSKDLNDPATSIEAGKTYYYQRTYYANNAQHEQWIDVLGENAIGKAVQDPSTKHYYAPAGTTRTGLSRLYTAEKTKNSTDTATNAIAPNWESNLVTVHLGNNGKQTVEGSGTLKVTEEVKWAEGATKDPNKEFPFTLKLEGNGFDGEFQAVIAGEEKTVKDGYTFTLKDGESAMVYGLTPGVKATVTQTGDHGGAGWSVNHETDAGEIEKNKTTELAFVNTYTLEPVTLDADSIKGSKTLIGRDWQTDSAFTFTMTAGDANPNAPLPNPATVEVKNPSTGEYTDGEKIGFAFGAIEYTKPGTYQYVITEQEGNKPKLSYSSARYVVTVTVSDKDGNGTMQVESVMTNTFDDEGHRLADAPTVESADFINTFTGENDAVASISGQKDYTDHTGSNPNDEVGKFNVKVEAAEINPSDGPVVSGAVSVGLDGTWRTPDLKFTDKMLHGQASQTFTYHVSEVVPVGVTADNPTLNGMTYDVNTYDVLVTLTRDAAGDLVTNVSYPDGKNRVELANSYRAENTDAQTLQVSKKVTGHDADAGKFAFNTKLTAGDANNVKIKQADDSLADWSDQATLSPAIANNATASIKLGDVVFTMPGTYTFAVTESNGGTTQDGWTYDGHTYSVTYTVNDEDGKLQATAAVNGSSTFANSYAASTNFGGTLQIGKTLTGRTMNAEEFSFIIEPVDGAPMPNGASSITTKNPFSSASGSELVWPIDSTLLANLHFTQADGGKTYRYTVREQMPEGVTEANKTKNGVTYDFTVHTLAITVNDDGMGNLTTSSTIDGDAQNTVAQFANTYSIAEGKASVQFSKQLTGRDWTDGDTFTFNLAPNAAGSTVSEEALKNAMPADTKASVGKPTGDAETSMFSFGDFTFTQAGNYSYTVKEQGAGTTTEGLTNDASTATVTFSVVDNGMGQYSIGTTVTGLDDSATFVNAYSTTDFTGVPTGMEFSKQLTGIAWPANATFEFTIKGVGENVPMPENTTVTVSKPASGDTAKFDFGNITYTKAGTYVYTITETEGTMKGVTYDLQPATVTVKVTDNGKGQLEAKASADKTAFVNAYSTTDFKGVPTGMEFSKQLTGIAWPASETFEFTITGVGDNVPMPENTKVTVSKPASGDTAKFDFGNITYTKAGTYEYEITETTGSMPGVAYDPHTAKVTVTVSDNSEGALGANAKVTSGTFLNEYSAKPAEGVPADFKLFKMVEGMDWADDQQFEFTLTAENGAPMPATNTATASKPADGSNTAGFDFGSITYNEKGVYKYTVSEKAGTQSGMTYDSHTANITVDVIDDGKGQLVAATTVENGLFTNRYSTQSVTYPGINVSEDLTGRAQAQGEFKFEVRGSEEDMQRAFGGNARAVISSVKSYDFDAAASGETVTVPGLFTGLELTHDDVRAEKVFSYEIDQTGATSGNGLTVDDTVYAVRIWASDNHDGTMSVHTSVDGTEVAGDQVITLPFHNFYEVGSVTIGGDASVRINATKTLIGREQNAGEFNFAVRDANGAEIASGMNAADGTISFSAIEFTGERLAADVKSGAAVAAVDGTQITYRYAVTVGEREDALPAGVTAVVSGYAVELVIVDNGAGELSASVNYPADANGSLSFVNQYGAESSAKVALSGNKVLKVASGDNAPDITGKYTFALTGSEGAPMPANTQVTNDAAGAIDFGEIEYTVANVFGEAAAEEPAEAENSAGAEESEEAGEAAEFAEAEDAQPTTREKTFTYTVSEAGAVSGVANDGSVYTVTVHVVDNGDGTLTVTKQSAQGAAEGMEFTFTNTYSVQPVGPTDPADPNNPVATGAVPMTKTINGRDLRAGEFEFEMLDANGAVVGTAKNAADGSVDLPGVTFDAPGNYAYMIREIAGNVGGVTYDTVTYSAVAQVVDNSDGTLGVAWEVTGADGELVSAMAFTNSYEAAPTSVGKLLQGRELEAGEFSFQMRGANENTPMPETAVDGVQTVANDANGNAQFGVIGYTQAGTYRYEVSEVKGDAEHVTYDESVHAVTVEVTDNGEGQLLATLKYSDDADGIVFRNVYIAPEEPEQPTEPTEPTEPENPSEPESPTAPTKPSTGSSSQMNNTASNRVTYVSSVARTGSSVALIVAAAFALIAIGAGLLMTRRRSE